jgi:hypothetical protein
MLLLLFCLISVCFALVHERSMLVYPRLHAVPRTAGFNHLSGQVLAPVGTCSSQLSFEWELENSFPQSIANHIQRMKSLRQGVFSISRPPVDVVVYTKLQKLLEKLRAQSTVKASSTGIRRSRHAAKEIQNNEVSLLPHVLWCGLV